MKQITTVNDVEWEYQPDAASWTNDKGEVWPVPGEKPRPTVQVEAWDVSVKNGPFARFTTEDAAKTALWEFANNWGTVSLTRITGIINWSDKKAAAEHGRALVAEAFGVDEMYAADCGGCE